MGTTRRQRGVGWIAFTLGGFAFVVASCMGGGGGTFGARLLEKKGAAKEEPREGEPQAGELGEAEGPAGEMPGGADEIDDELAGLMGDEEVAQEPAPEKEPAPRRVGAAQGHGPKTPAVGKLDSPAHQKLAELAGKKTVGRAASKAQAQLHYRRGRALYDDVRYEEAVRELEKALEYFPNHAAARIYLRKTRSLLGIDLDKIRGALVQLSWEKRVKIQEALVEMENALERARQFHINARVQQEEGQEKVERDVLYSGRIRHLTKAIEGYSRVLEIIRWMPYNIDLSGTRSKTRALRRQAQQQKRATWNALRAYQMRKARQRAEAEREKEIEFHEDKIRKLTVQARVRFQKEQFKQCEALCLKILEVDPDNAEVQMLFKRARTRKHEFEERHTYQFRRFEAKNSMYNVEESTIPYDRHLVYPDHWEKIVQRVEKGGIGGVALEQEWQKDIRRKLQRKVSFEFVDTPLSEVIRFLQTLTKVNMILDPQVEGGGDTPINLKIQNMTLELALEWILRLAELDYALKDDAVFISSPDRLVDEVVLRIYDVADLVGSTRDFPGPDFQLTVGQTTDGGAGGMAIFEEGGEEAEDASSLARMIQTRVKPNSWAPELGTSIEQHGNRLVVMQRPEVHRLIDKLLANFRAAQNLMVTIEARFLEVREGFFEDIGFDWGGPIETVVPGFAATGVNNILAPTIASDRLTGPIPAGIINRPQALDLSGRGTLYTIGALTNSVVNNSPESTAIARRSPSQLSEGLNASISYVGKIEAQAFLHALRIREAGSELAAPRLTVYNTQRAHMFMAEQTSYIADYEISGDAYDPVIRQFLRGVIFDVRPIVSADRRYITLELRPTTVDLIGQVRVEMINTIQVIDSTPPVIINLALPVQLPELEIRKVRTTVTIPDGGIILIGGMMRNVKFQTETGVPFISNIPVIGKFFRWNRTDNERSNLIIMVTARIVLFDEEERKL